MFAFLVSWTSLLPSGETDKVDGTSYYLFYKTIFRCIVLKFKKKKCSIVYCLLKHLVKNTELHLDLIGWLHILVRHK